MVASAASRTIAGVVDFILLATLDAGVVGLTLRLAGLTMASLGVLPATPLCAFLLLLNAGYLVVLTATGGQTFGQMVVGIRVVDVAGQPVPVVSALLRATMLVVSLVPAGVGLVWIWIARDHRGLHDRVAGTRVVVVQPSS
ncbi:MAG: RDD family protein [Acidobacteria bacterium]|nr:RDD family protein [Acidobacteriota bacterium]